MTHVYGYLWNGRVDTFEAECKKPPDDGVLRVTMWRRKWCRRISLLIYPWSDAYHQPWLITRSCLPYTKESNVMRTVSEVFVIPYTKVTQAKKKPQVWRLEDLYSLSRSRFILSLPHFQLLLQPLIVTRPPFHRGASIKRPFWWVDWLIDKTDESN